MRIKNIVGLLLSISVGLWLAYMTPGPEPVYLEAIEPVVIYEPPVEPEEAPEPEPVIELDPRDVELIGRTIWGEAGGVKSTAERAAVAWCILNRVDAWGGSIEETVTAPYQFKGYRDWGECPQEHLDLAADVLTRWQAEKAGAEGVGRVLPEGYLFFVGDLVAHNYFSEEWKSGIYWDWSLPDPYEQGEEL